MAVATDRGINHLTIDNVAAAAGLSKGGVFYHFRNKEELLIAMVGQIISEFKQECHRLVDQGMTPIQATIESSFDESQENKNRISALVAAVAFDKKISAQFQSNYEEWLNELAVGGISRATARLVTTAIDGYYIGMALGVGAMDNLEREQLKQSLLSLARPSEEEILFNMLTEALRREDEKAATFESAAV